MWPGFHVDHERGRLVGFTFSVRQRQGVRLPVFRQESWHPEDVVVVNHVPRYRLSPTRAHSRQVQELHQGVKILRQLRQDVAKVSFRKFALPDVVSGFTANRKVRDVSEVDFLCLLEGMVEPWHEDRRDACLSSSVHPSRPTQ